MKLALSLLLLVAYAHAIPITKDTRTKVDTPTVIVGSSQVDGKKDGKVTLHLDQRSQIPEPQVPVVSVPKTVQVVEEPKKQEPDVLSARNDIIPPKSEETIRTPQSEDTRPVKTELGARNQVPLQTVQVPSQDTPAIRQVVEPQVTQQVVPDVQRLTTVVVEEVPVPVISSQPAILVLSQEPARIPVGGQEIPQAVIESIIVPEGPQVIAQPIEIPEVPRVVAVLEERSTPVIQTTPVVQTSPVASNVLPVKESIEPQTKVVPKQQGGESRNLRVEQVPVKAPIAVSSPIQKQVPVIKSEVPSQQQQQQIVPEVVKPKVQEPISRVVLEERRSEEVRPIRVESLVVPEKAIIRNEPAAVIPAVQPQESSIRTTETREPAQIQPIRVSEPTLVKPIRVESLVVPEQPIRKEPVVISPVVQPQETSVRATSEIRERVQVQPIQTTQIRASDIRREPEQVQGSIRAETSPVVQSKQTNIRNEVPSVKVQLPEEKLQ